MVKNTSNANRIYLKLDELVIDRDYKGVGKIFSTEGYSLDDVAKTYGEYSEHHEVYSLYLAEKTLEQEVLRSVNYKIPGRTESPFVTGGMAKRWIIDFHEMNNMELPKSFWKKNAKQLRGMLNGMMNSYDIDIEDIVKK